MIIISKNLEEEKYVKLSSLFQYVDDYTSLPCANSEEAVIPTVEPDIIEDTLNTPEVISNLDGASTDLPDQSSPHVAQDLPSQMSVVDRPRRAAKPNPKYSSETYDLS